MNSDATPSARRPAPRVVVIGYGNPLRGDDALGGLAADQLADQLRDPRLEVLSCHALTPDLAAELATATLAIFLDASLDGPVGGVICRPLNVLAEQPVLPGHQSSPAALLAWSRSLYGRAPECYLLSVRGVSFDLADCQLTPTVEAALRPLCDKVRSLVEQHLTNHEPQGQRTKDEGRRTKRSGYEALPRNPLHARLRLTEGPR